MRTILEEDSLSIGVDLGHGAVVTKASLFLGQGVCYGNPDATGTAVGREAKQRIGAPVTGNFVEDDVLHDEFGIWCGNTLTNPRSVHLRDVNER